MIDFMVGKNETDVCCNTQLGNLLLAFFWATLLIQQCHYLDHTVPNGSATDELKRTW